MDEDGAALSGEIVSVGPQDRELISEIIALGDRYKRTLGFLPSAVFHQAALSDTLIAVIAGDRVAGYALYALPRQVVRLTHLCVSEEMRGYGLARLMVEDISKRHAGRLGIVLRCRKDYDFNRVWPHLGFELIREVPGRSRERLPLCVWRRDHGHPDLFSTAESLGLLRVALDLNVFLDIELSKDRGGGSAESRTLTDDWLADQVELVVTTELLREVHRLTREPEKSKQLLAAQRYRMLPSHSGAVEATAQRIVNHVAHTQRIDLSADAGDQSDVRHVAEAALAGVTVLATRDEALLRWSSGATDVCGVRVMRPADVVLHVDELSRAQAYRPIELQGTEYRLTPVRFSSDAGLMTFLNDTKGERRRDYITRVRSLIAEGRRWERTLLHDPRHEPIAFYVVGVQDRELVVPILRAKSGRLENTILRQLIAILRAQARRERISLVRILDSNLSKSTERALNEDGFIRHNGNWIGFVISVCADSAAVDQLTSQAAQTMELVMPTLRPQLSPVIAAELERALWPAKIIDSDLPNYLIPIKSVWSAELFGVPQVLTPRPNRLGLSREHVYYRSPRPRVEQAPARLLWYATGSQGGGVAAVIGCSRLEEVLCDKPTALHHAFRHLGVWQREQVEMAAHRDQALALRFADTEIFPRMVSLTRLRQLAAQNRQRLWLRSPQKISAQLFAAIYQEGHPDE